MIKYGDLSPWYTNKIRIIKTGDKPTNDIEFEGDLPFVIDETSDHWSESFYYVEQTFRDPAYGLPIVTRIGIIPRELKEKKGIILSRR